MTRKKISNYRQSRRDANEQQILNRLAHARWERELHPEVTWKFAVGLGLFIAGLILYGILTKAMPV